MSQPNAAAPKPAGRFKLQPWRIAGKALLYLGIFFTAVGSFNAMQPYLKLQKAQFVQAKVLRNEFVRKTSNGYAFQMQLSWNPGTTEQSERRIVITNLVKGSSQADAEANYKGRHYQAGQSYAMPLNPDDQERIEPWLGYNWNTFGRPLILTGAGLGLFLIGMALVRHFRRLS